MLNSDHLLPAIHIDFQFSRLQKDNTNCNVNAEETNILNLQHFNFSLQVRVHVLAWEPLDRGNLPVRRLLDL